MGQQGTHRNVFHKNMSWYNYHKEFWSEGHGNSYYKNM